MDGSEPAPHDSEPSIHWLVRGVMWVLAALCLALLCTIAIAPFFHATSPTPSATAWWTALESAGVACGCCVLGAGYLGTLAWRGHFQIKGVTWIDHRPVAPRLPWYVRVWAGIVCAGMLMLLIAQLHKVAAGDASWLSTLPACVMVIVTFWYLLAPLATGRWSKASVRSAALFTMTPREIHAAAKAEHARRRGV